MYNTCTVIDGLHYPPSMVVWAAADNVNVLNRSRYITRGYNKLEYANRVYFYMHYNYNNTSTIEHNDVAQDKKNRQLITPQRHFDGLIIMGTRHLLSSSTEEVLGYRGCWGLSRLNQCWLHRAAINAVVMLVKRVLIFCLSSQIWRHMLCRPTCWQHVGEIPS